MRAIQRFHTIFFYLSYLLELDPSEPPISSDSLGSEFDAATDDQIEYNRATQINGEDESKALLMDLFYILVEQ